MTKDEEYLEKNRDLFIRQKEMLEQFAVTGAISKEYCDKEIKILEDKMKF